MPMTPVSPGPSTNDPENFAPRADTLFSTDLPRFVEEANALEANVVAKEESAVAAATAVANALGQAQEQVVLAALQVEAAQGKVDDAAEQVVLAADQVDLATDQALLATAAALTAITAPGTSATSTTSLTMALGPQSLTIQTGKALVPGMAVQIAYTTTPKTYMHGIITAYDSITGALDVDVTAMDGVSGTYVTWTISLSSPAGSGASGAKLYFFGGM